MPTFRGRYSSFLFYVAAGGAGGAAPHVLAAPSASLVIRHVNVVDVASGGIARDRTVEIRGNRIVRVVGGAAPTSGTTVVDGRGRYLIPGLWDMHVHLAMSPESALTLGRRARDVYMPGLLAAGVTGVRDMGSWLDTIDVLRRETREGSIIGPRMVIAGALLAGRNPWAPPSPHAWVVESAAQARHAVDSLSRRGVDFIKAHDLLKRDVYLAIAEEARVVHLPLAGHMRPDLSVDDILAAGQKGFEHVPIELAAACTPGDTARARAFYAAWIGRGWTAFVQETARVWSDRDPERCARMLARVRDAGVRLTPTLVLRMQDGAWTGGDHMTLTPGNSTACAAMLSDWGGLADSLRQRSYRTAFDIVRTAREAGVAVLAGTDGPGGCLAPGRSLIREVQLLHRAGLSRLQALQAATLEPARYLGMSDSLGTVGAGKVADLVLLDADPLADLATLENPAGVIMNGHWIDRRALKRLRLAAAAAASH